MDDVRRKRLRVLLTPELRSVVILASVTLLFAVCVWRGDAAHSPVPGSLLRLHDRLLLAVGGDSVGDVYITKERLLQRTVSYDADAVHAAADAVNAYAAESEIPVYMLPVPTSLGIYADTLPEHAPVVNERNILRSFNEALSDQVIRLEAESWLSAERDQYIYYRTDPCWTTYGAFSVYRAAIRRLGFTPVGYDQFTVDHFSSDYFGRLAQQAQYFDCTPDLVDIYRSKTEEPLRSVTAIRPEGTEQLYVYYREQRASDTGNPADVFAAANEPVLRIETRNQSSRDLLFITDDFGSSFLPFLLLHYHTVTAVNLSSIGDADWRALTKGSYSQVLILSACPFPALAQLF